MHRDLSSIPVLLRAGGILPLAAADADLSLLTALPDLEVTVAAGADGAFTLTEELAEEGQWVRTEIGLDVSAGSLSISTDGPAFGTERGLTLRLLGFDAAAFEDAKINGRRVDVQVDDAAVRITVPAQSGDPQAADGAAPGTIQLSSAGLGTMGRNDVHRRVLDLLSSAQIGYGLKERLMTAIDSDGAASIASWQSFGSAPSGHSPVTHPYDQAGPELLSALAEILGAE